MGHINRKAIDLRRADPGFEMAERYADNDDERILLAKVGIGLAATGMIIRAAGRLTGLFSRTI